MYQQPLYILQLLERQRRRPHLGLRLAGHAIEYFVGGIIAALGVLFVIWLVQ